MLLGATKYLWDKLPYIRYKDANNNQSRAEGGAIEEVGVGASGQSSETAGENRSESTSIKIGEECKLEGVEQIDTYASPTPSTPNSPRAHGSTHITVAGNHYYRTGELLSYNERSGECTVVDSHGNLVTIRTCGNPWKSNAK